MYETCLALLFDVVSNIDCLTILNQSLLTTFIVTHSVWWPDWGWIWEVLHGTMDMAADLLKRCAGRKDLKRPVASLERMAPCRERHTYATAYAYLMASTSICTFTHDYEKCMYSKAHATRPRGSVRHSAVNLEVVLLTPLHWCRASRAPQHRWDAEQRVAIFNVLVAC